jgi:hypothetical protein
VAKKFWGERAKVEAPKPAEPKEVPPKDPETGRFVPAVKPTALARPTARAGVTPSDDGVPEAVLAVKAKIAEFQRNGS